MQQIHSWSREQFKVPRVDLMVGGEQQCHDAGWAAQAERGERKREQEQDEDKDKPHSLGNRICPPHPGLVHGVCYLCGKDVTEEPESARVPLWFIHKDLDICPEEAARMRREELKHIMLKQKLYLVLDLDHTMLNSVSFDEVLTEEEAHLAACYSTGGVLGEGEPGYRNGLHRVSHLQMWTKLRPYAHEFIEEVSKICEIFVYTLGDREYALAMARLLDPTGQFFGDRIISRRDSTRNTLKDLDVLLVAESAVVILDDTKEVWPKHRANLVLMERYHFFKSSRVQSCFSGLSLTERGRDESEGEGALAIALKTIRCVHQAFFSTANPLGRGILKETTDYVDVTKVIQSLRGKILNGCRVVLENSPTGQIWLNSPAGQICLHAAELGALCSNVTDSSTTHVLSFDPGTDKALWAKRNGKFVVHPCWVKAAMYLWCRPREEDFAVGENESSPSLTSFAKTVPAMLESNTEQ